ncbi:MAG: orotidine-5'-phosphate decarboxylase [candidate division WOR-3 bacterium]
MEEALKWVDTLGELQKFYKVGLPLYLRYGKVIIDELRKRGKRIFLDLKLHDIPSVVAESIKPFERGDAEILTIHITGGEKMLRESIHVAREKGINLAGVTLLTSLSRLDVQRLFAYPCELERVVESMITVAVECGLDFVVLSGQEVKKIGLNFKGKIGFIVPAVRLEGEEVQDQERVISPQEAKVLGVNYIVVGRPITHSTDPVRALQMYQKALE